MESRSNNNKKIKFADDSEENDNRNGKDEGNNDLPTFTKFRPRLNSTFIYVNKKK